MKIEIKEKRRQNRHQAAEVTDDISKPFFRFGIKSDNEKESRNYHRSIILLDDKSNGVHEANEKNRLPRPFFFKQPEANHNCHYSFNVIKSKPSWRNRNKSKRD